MSYIVNLILRLLSRLFDNINNAPVNIFAANLKGIFLISFFYKLTEVKLLGQRECTDYLLKISEMSNMVLDAVLKDIWPKKSIEYGFHTEDKNFFRVKGVRLNLGFT